MMYNYIIALMERLMCLFSNNSHLSTYVSYTDYTIHLTVDIDQFSVTGSSLINLNIIKETDCIIIHFKMMNITGYRVKQNDEFVTVHNSFTYEENDFYVLKLSKSLTVGTASLGLEYSYKLGDDLVGFYRSSYTDTNGTLHWIATTQFEPTDARKAFPCFDEPSLKANFTIKITHSKTLNAHSNMPVVSNSTNGAMMTTVFDTSVKMSTYLVAFVVSDFECMSRTTKTAKNVTVSSYTN